MVSIGLICEGASEISMLAYIINRYLGDNVVVNAIQPSMKTIHGQEKQDDYGGWLQVLNHCTDETIQNVMASNDFLVIQIDTDACIQANYDVGIFDKNHQKVSDNILFDRVIKRLKEGLSDKVLEKYSDKILFAVCINETECWLLPLYYENDAKKRCSTTNCIHILNQRLQADGVGIPEKAKNTPEAVRVYQKVLKKMKSKDIPRVAQYNYGFQKFVEQMDAIKSIMADSE